MGDYHAVPSSPSDAHQAGSSEYGAGATRLRHSKGLFLSKKFLPGISTIFLVALLLLVLPLYTDISLTTDVVRPLRWAASKQEVVTWRPIGTLKSPRPPPIASQNITAPPIVKPFYFRARMSIDMHSDVTVFSMATENRLELVQTLAEQYQGPISLAYWMPATDSNVRESSLGSLQSVVRQSKAVRDWVDIHLVIDDSEKELNRWRNVARTYAKTDYVLMHDIDFWLPPSLRNKFSEPSLQAALREGKEAFVVPCFVAIDNAIAIRPDLYPKTKELLVTAVKEGKFELPNLPYWQNHSATNYPRWYVLPEESTDYYPAALGHPDDYEPYFVFNTHTTPYCSEMFSHWADKVACVYEMYIAGVDMRVLPGAWAIHSGLLHSTGPPTTPERIWAATEFDNWRLEICHRYLGYYSKTLLLDDPVSSQFRQACARQPGISEPLTRMLQIKQ